MQSCFLVKGIGYSVRAWILAGSAFSYLFPTTKLGKTQRKGKNSHFSGFTYSLFFKTLPNPSLMCWISVSASLHNIKKTNLLSMSLRMPLIMAWKMAGELVRPKCIT